MRRFWNEKEQKKKLLPDYGKLDTEEKVLVCEQIENDPHIKLPSAVTNV